MPARSTHQLAPAASAGVDMPSLELSRALGMSQNVGEDLAHGPGQEKGSLSYRTQALEEVSIAALYVGAMEEGRQATRE